MESKLEEFFSNLQDRSITVKQNLGQNIREGYFSIDKYRNFSDIGFCFYHKGDARLAAKCGKLYLSWGAYSGDDIDILTVANAIIDEGQTCGLEMSWNGSITDRIIVLNVDPEYFENNL